MRERSKEFNKRLAWRRRLAEKAAKGIDVSVVNSHGLGWKEIAAIGVIAMVCLFWLRQADTPPVDTPPGYEVQFYDADGNRLAIDHRPLQ